jgi:hypothetical protein
VKSVYTFFGWVRQGLSGAGLPPDSIADLPARPNIPLTLTVKDNAPVSNSVRIAGPGDVLGIDRRQVVRCDPAFFTQNFEPTFLAAIEFDRPDFPWMFTPAAPNVVRQLRPWICLVVIKRGQGVEIRSTPGTKTPVLEIGEPARPADELPDLKESWAWAHAQVAGVAENPNAEILFGSPERTVSRLICPRRLEPYTNYIACVVPTFVEDGQSAKPAWRVDDPSLTKVRLPVYYSWEFSTGPAGDFKSLIGKLEHRSAAGLGMREMVVDGEIVTFEGAFKVSNSTSTGLSNAAGQAYRAKLRALVNAPGPDDTPKVTPPIYAGHYRDVVKLPEDSAPPGWLADLNLDPRFRAIAALGTRVVQIQQEALMASAWEQAGDAERANAILRNAQLLRAASNSVFVNHLNRLSDSSVLEVTRPVHGRVIVKATASTTIEGKIAQSNTPVSVTTSAFRRITRPRGPILRRILPAGQTALPIIANIATRKISLDVAPPISEIIAGAEIGPFPIDLERVGVVTPELAETQWLNKGGHRPAGGIPVDFGWIADAFISSITPPPNFNISKALISGTNFEFPVPSQGVAERFRAAFAAHQPLILPKPLQSPTPTELPVEGLATDVREKLNPAATVPNLVRPMIKVLAAHDHGSAAATDELGPLQIAPQFSQPMYEGVRDLSQELLLPGLESVVENSILLLEANPRFIEAYMAGLNHEMDRELFWRGYPAHRLNTPFRYFWDTRGRASGPGDGDIKPIEEWNPNNTLGSNAVGFAKPLPVLLIRSELLRRYPTAVIYAVPAVWQDGQAKPVLGGETKYPFFQGSFKADIRFFGFAIPRQTLLGNQTGSAPGYFFVIQEHPTEPRFGPKTNVTGTGFLKPLGDSAETAQLLLQQPVRIAIHAHDLLQV